MYGEEHMDYFGQHVSALGDVDADGFDDFAVGADGVADSSVEPNLGRTYIFMGPRSSGGGTLVADLAWSGTLAYDVPGWSLAEPAQQPDGTMQVAMGAPGRLGSGGVHDTPGKVYTFPFTEESNSVAALADIALMGSQIGDMAGASVSDRADLDGDAVDDFAVGAPRDDSHGEDAGLVYIVSGAQLEQLRPAH